VAKGLLSFLVAECRRQQASQFYRSTLLEETFTLVMGVSFLPKPIKNLVGLGKFDDLFKFRVIGSKLSRSVGVETA